MAYRQAVDSTAVPKELASISLKSQSEAPQLFGGAEKGRGKGKRSRETKEKEERTGGKDQRRSARDADRPRRKDKVTDEAEVMADGPSAQGAVQLKESEEKMNLESFLNYVAFNKKAQVQVLDLSEANAEKANAEAQMVLRGALNFKRVDVAKELYEQLAAANVDIFSATFSLMIEASVLAKDLKTSSDFLMKMESSGHSPSSELLDKVLDLYSNQKTQREQVKNKSSNKEDEIISGATEKEVILPRQKLKSDARIFVPSFGIPPPPPKPKREESPVEADSQRTKLVATAKPFEPGTWMLDVPQEDFMTGQEVYEGGKQTYPRNGKKEEAKKMWKPKAPACAPMD